jgi:hypothetical protein
MWLSLYKTSSCLLLQLFVLYLGFGIRDALRLQPNYSTDKFLKEPLSSAYKNLSGF